MKHTNSKNEDFKIYWFEINLRSIINDKESRYLTNGANCKSNPEARKVHFLKDADSVSNEYLKEKKKKLTYFVSEKRRM